MTTSKKVPSAAIRSAAARSTGAVSARMPPKAAIGSPAMAMSTAVRASDAAAAPQGLVCLTTTADTRPEVIFIERASSRAALASFMLLKLSALPCSCRALTSVPAGALGVR